MNNLVTRPLPLGRSTFSALRAQDAVYVDKTRMVYELCRDDNKIFLSRPRRFGKSLLVSTFESLFKYGLRDFGGLAVEKLWKDTVYSVVHLDFSDLKNVKTRTQFEETFNQSILEGFRESGFRYDSNVSLSVHNQFKAWMKSLAERSLVLLIDEYDAPLTACLDDEKLFNDIQGVMENFFSVIKSNEGCLRFFFLTGITKFTGTGIFSVFNNITDITLDPKYGQLLGYTENEIQRDFSGYLCEAAKMLNLSESELLDRLRTAYDGFSFDERASTHVYNPWSVLSFLNRPDRGFANYWYASGVKPTGLMRYLQTHELDRPENYTQVRSVYLSDLTEPADYQVLHPEVFLVQTGYLTIKSVNDEGTVTLGYPNREVSASMAQLYVRHLLDGQPFTPQGLPTLRTLFATGRVADIVDRFNNVINRISSLAFHIANEASCRNSIQMFLEGGALSGRTPDGGVAIFSRRYFYS